MKQIFNIGNIVHQLFVYQSLSFESIAQIKLHYFLTVDSNYPYELSDLQL